MTTRTSRQRADDLLHILRHHGCAVRREGAYLAVDMPDTAKVPPGFVLALADVQAVALELLDLEGPAPAPRHPVAEPQVLPLRAPPAPKPATTATGQTRTGTRQGA